MFSAVICVLFAGVQHARWLQNTTICCGGTQEIINGTSQIPKCLSKCNLRQVFVRTVRLPFKKGQLPCKTLQTYNIHMVDNLQMVVGPLHLLQNQDSV